MHDIQRTCVKSIKYLLKHFPCVAVLGARQVGKTTLLKQVYPNASFFDAERRTDYDRIKRDPDFFLSQYNHPIVIDEAQSLPDLFKALRVAIDSKRKINGRYLISGSSSPELLKQINESLAGRIAIFELGGLSLEEAWGKPENPLYRLLANKKIKRIFSLEPRFSIKQLFTSCLLGSYPEPFLKYRRNTKLFSLWMENYFQSYIKRDVRNIFPGLNIENYQKFVAMLASASGQLLNAAEFARSLDVSQPTAKFYFQIADGTFVWRMIPSYQKNIKKRVIKMPKGQMRDTGLLNNILKNKTIDSLQTHPLYGRIWESFIAEQLLKGFGNNLISVDPFFYRTSNKAEIDLVLEGDFGILPVEIKSSTIVSAKNIIALENFIKEKRIDFGILINNAKEITWLSKKVLQIPAAFL